MNVLRTLILLTICLFSIDMNARGFYPPLNTSCSDCISDASFRQAADIAAKRASQNDYQYQGDIHVFNFLTNDIQRWKISYVENPEQPSQPPFYYATKLASDSNKVAIATDIINQFKDLLFYKVPNVHNQSDPNQRGFPFEEMDDEHCDSAFDVTRFSRCRNIIGDWLTDKNIFNARAGAFANLVWDRLQISETVYQISISFADGSVSVFRIDTVSTDDFGARKNRYFINYKKNSSKDKLDNDIPESINDIKSQGFVVHHEVAGAWSALFSRLTGTTINLNIPTGCVIIIDCSDDGQSCSADESVPAPGSSTTADQCNG